MQLLFEKLVQDGDPGRAVPLEAAIRAQVERTLHSHVGVDPDAPIDLVNDGLAPSCQVGGGSELEQYARRLGDLVRHYEPRLRDVVVEVDTLGDAGTPARLNLRARLAEHLGDEFVAFPLDVESR